MKSLLLQAGFAGYLNTSEGPDAGIESTSMMTLSRDGRAGETR